MGPRIRGGDGLARATCPTTPSWLLARDRQIPRPIQRPGSGDPGRAER